MPRKTEEELPSTALVLPGTGEVVDLANPDEAAQVYFQLGVLEAQVREARHLVRDALVQHAEQYGSNTMRVPSAEVKVTKSDDIEWDLRVLVELRDAGLPAERWNELVVETVDRKVSGVVAKQIAKANPVYAEIIERAQTRRPKRPAVSVVMRAETVR